MKRKKELIVILSSLLVIVLSVSVAYFTTKILGTEKDISVTSADLKVIFTSGSGTINGTSIEPGWTSGENTFTIKNESNGAYNYNIIIKDLVNTFTTSGFLVYKITSTDGGYNMTNFENVPKSKTSKDKVLAYNISIDSGATHTYTVEYKYLESTEVDQSADMGKILTGKIFITKGTERPTLANQLLNDNPTISTRTSFNTPFIDNTVETLYKATENNTDVYYFAGLDYVQAHCEYNNQIIYPDGSSVTLTESECISELTICDTGERLFYGTTNCEDSGWTKITITDGKWVEKETKPINNWVKFGKYQNDYIKYRGYHSSTSSSYREYSTMEECTSSDYNYNCTAYKYASAGDDIYWRIIRTNADGSIRLIYNGTDTNNLSSIGKSSYNESYNSPKYVGYMYGDDDTTLDGIRANINDSTIKTFIDNWYENNLTAYTNYLSNDAIYCNDRELKTGSTYSTSKIEFISPERIASPSYDCTNTKDAFSVNNTAAKLKYPIALISSDEISYAGGLNAIFSTWLNDNSDSGNFYFTNSVIGWKKPLLFTYYMLSSYGSVSSVHVASGTAHLVRPVTSLKSCVTWKSGDGSASNPYEIVENGGC